MLHILSYKDKEKGWNWGNFVAGYMEQHNIRSGLEEHGYSTMDAQTQVCFLMNGTKTADSVNTTILASSTTLHQNFGAVTILYSDFTKQTGALNPIKISAVNIHSRMVVETAVAPAKVAVAAMAAVVKGEGTATDMSPLAPSISVAKL